jgi:hypothetical protein
MKYQTISATNLKTLEDAVNNEMRHGWRVTGGLAAYPGQEIKGPLHLRSAIFVQAMIHEGNTEP